VLRVAAVATLLVAFGVAPVTAQPGFRLTHSIARTTATHVEVGGAVANEGRGDAVDVSVTVEALAGSKVVARGITFVSPRIPERGSAQFVAKVPVVDGVTGYRAVVSTYRFISTGESP
jgi:hypothetical protein